MTLLVTAGTAAAALGLVAFRLFWGVPGFRVLLRHFPARWQRWLLDETH